MREQLQLEYPLEVEGTYFARELEAIRNASRVCDEDEACAARHSSVKIRLVSICCQ